MTDEFDRFKKTIQSITTGQFNTANSLVGKIVDYTPNMQYCNVEVDINGGRHTFVNIPAHGYPVKGSSCIIHFHNGNIEQPVCDCAYRMNPPDSVIREEIVDSCFNYHNNGDFLYGLEGYTVGPDKDSVTLYNETFTDMGQSCVLQHFGSYLEFTVDISQCTSKYFKFQCVYRGLGQLRVECHNAETGDVIQNVPEDIGQDYKIWTTSLGRFRWAYNKEVYKRVNYDEDIVNTSVKFKVSNYSEKDTEHYVDGELIKTPTAMSVDGLLVFDENGGTNYFNSEKDMLRYHKIE